MMNDGWTDMGEGGRGAEPTTVSAYQRVSVSGQYQYQDVMWVLVMEEGRGDSDQIDGTLRSNTACSSLTWSERSVGDEQVPREWRRAFRRHR
jgi:hypothetical protein